MPASQGGRKRPIVPSRHTIMNIHKKMRSITMATYFQSSFTCVKLRATGRNREKKEVKKFDVKVWLYSPQFALLVRAQWGRLCFMHMHFSCVGWCVPAAHFSQFHFLMISFEHTQKKSSTHCGPLSFLICPKKLKTGSVQWAHWDEATASESNCSALGSRFVSGGGSC